METVTTQTLKTQIETIDALVNARKESQKELKAVFDTTIQRIRWALQDSIDSLGIKELEIVQGCTIAKINALVG